MAKKWATILLLAVCLVLPQMMTANGPPQHRELSQAVSAVSPGSELWREVRQRDLPLQELVQGEGTTQVRGVDSGVLINAHGDRWARFRRDNPVRHAPTVLLAVLVILFLFFTLRGKIVVEGGLSGRMVQRFTDYERIVHWTLAIVFLWLAITGLVLLLGRTLLLPLLGNQVFPVLASASKESHNLIGPIFLVSLIMMLLSFTRHNIYEKGDLTWLLTGGGSIGKGHPSVGFFNMGEKSWYWILILIGLLVSISGLILVSPNFGQGRVIMAISHLVHVFGAVILIAASLGHMYLGTVGLAGSLDAMKSGYVDYNWAKAHHDRWASRLKENDEVLSAEEYARLQGRKLVSTEDNPAEQGK